MRSSLRYNTFIKKIEIKKKLIENYFLNAEGGKITKDLISDDMKAYEELSNDSDSMNMTKISKITSLISHLATKHQLCRSKSIVWLVPAKLLWVLFSSPCLLT